MERIAEASTLRPDFPGHHLRHASKAIKDDTHQIRNDTAEIRHVRSDIERMGVTLERISSELADLRGRLSVILFPSENIQSVRMQQYLDVLASYAEESRRKIIKSWGPRSNFQYGWDLKSK